MAFSYTKNKMTVAGSWRRVSGTFTNADTDVGGDVVTGLKTAKAYGAAITSHTDAANVKITESSGTLTLVCQEGVDGVWWAEGV